MFTPKRVLQNLFRNEHMSISWKRAAYGKRNNSKMATDISRFHIFRTFPYEIICIPETLFLCLFPLCDVIL